MYEYWCDGRLKAKAEGSTHLTYTGLRGGLEHLKIETRLRDERVENVMGECDLEAVRAPSMFKVICSAAPLGGLLPTFDLTLLFLVYYEGIKRELKRRPIYECRCHERIKTKAGGLHASHTLLVGIYLRLRTFINYPDAHELTPLHIVATKGHAAVTEQLIAARCSVNLSTKAGFMPLHYAACQEQGAFTRSSLLRAVTSIFGKDGFTAGAKRRITPRSRRIRRGQGQGLFLRMTRLIVLQR
jgi:hypothetical protein